MERGAISTPTPAPLAPLTSAVITSNVGSRRLQLSTNSLAEADIEDDDDDAAGGWAPPGRLINERLQETAQLGPLIRCASARSNPVAQLRFFINNRPVNLTRTLENSTFSYSDGLDSSQVSFRVELADFVAPSPSQQFDDEPEREGSLAKAGSKRLGDKAGSRKPTGKGRPNPSSTSTSSTSTSTTTTTTSTSTTTTTSTSTTARPSANANVQFDEDGALSKRAGEPGKPLPVSGKRNRQRPPKKRPNEPERSRPDPRASPDRDGTDEPFPHDERDKVDPDDRKWGSSAAKRTKSFIDLAGAANYKLTAVGRAKRHLDLSESSSAPSRGPKQLLAEEQRNRRQQQQPNYSSYIKIKCTSLVPAVGYEMTSELNVPLTLLVPAGQLSEAMRRPIGQGGAQAGPPSQPRRNPSNSLQEPQTVLIDRMAQASTPPLGVRAPAPNSSAPARAPARPATSKLDQRAKYLEELAKQMKPASGECQSSP